MKIATYNLKGNDINSDKYYEKVTVVSKRIKRLIFNKANNYLIDFINYIEINNIEDIRTVDEYAIELLMIGVFLSDYGLCGNSLVNGLSGVFKLLNNLREKSNLKNKVDKVRGYLISSVLYKKNNNNEKYYINKLFYWISASGDFKEEAYRLKNWVSFLDGKDKEYNNSFIKDVINVAKNMEELCEEELSVYIKPLESFLESASQKYKNREDLIYCTKGRKQYYFNMVSAEIMNEVYSKEFLKCKNKKIFVPACMRQVNKECKSTEGNFGYQCKKCNSDCNIYLLNKLVSKCGIEVCIIPHETIINTLNRPKENKIGIVGIACITNLMSGGWKALRLGFIPQCVILDYCGCEKHWLDKGQMTSININYINRFLTSIV